MKQFLKHFRNFAALAALALTQSALALSPPARLPIKTITVGKHMVQAELAISPADRAQGLMFRESMPANHGMLFMFEETAGHCFWMRNTPLPLAIGFFDESGVLINTLEMKPFDESPQCPTKPARYALEMNTGWFAKNAVKAGAKLGGAPKPVGLK